MQLQKENDHETRNNEHSIFRSENKTAENGEAPILMRITINGQYEEIRIQRSVPLKNWNPAKGCSKGKDRASIELNNYISALTTRAYEMHKELTFESALITPKTILKRVFGKDETVRTLLGTVKEEISSMEKVIDIDYSPVTINRYKNVLRKLETFVPRFYEKDDITFHELSHDFIKALMFPEDRSRTVPQHNSPLHEMPEENHQYGNSQRMDAKRPVLRI